MNFSMNSQAGFRKSINGFNKDDVTNFINAQSQEFFRKEAEYKSENKALKDENEKLSKVKDENEKLIRTNQEKNAENDKLIAENKRIVEEKALLTAENKKAVEDNEKLLEENIKLSDENTALKNDIAKFNSDMAKSALDLAKLNEKNTVLQAENTRLSNENAYLSSRSVEPQRVTLESFAPSALDSETLKKADLYDKMSDKLGVILMNANSAAEDIITEANDRADEILARANENAQRIREQAQAEAKSLVEDIQNSLRDTTFGYSEEVSLFITETRDRLNSFLSDIQRRGKELGVKYAAHDTAIDDLAQIKPQKSEDITIESAIMHSYQPQKKPVSRKGTTSESRVESFIRSITGNTKK